MSGRVSVLTLMGMKFSSIVAITFSLEKVVRSMTWHQWHQTADIDRSICIVAVWKLTCNRVGCHHYLRCVAVIPFMPVVAFQRRNGLRVDGLVGPQTWRALGFGYTVAAAVAPPTYRPAPMASRSASVDLIARAISAEARGEPYRGQVAVGAVLMNRLRNARFPNSLSAVIFQPHALESVSNGLFWRRTPDAAAYSAARDAINGYDPSYGSLFFWRCV